MTPNPSAVTPSPRALVRVLLLVVGSGSLALGVLGMFLPLLPTTPFVLLAAGCFAHAWPRAHAWLRGSAWFGPICRSGEEGRYLPPRAKGIALVMTTLSFAATIVFGPTSWWVRGPVLALGLVIVTWLSRLPTQPPEHGGMAHGP